MAAHVATRRMKRNEHMARSSGGTIIQRVAGGAVSHAGPGLARQDPVGFRAEGRCPAVAVGDEGVIPSRAGPGSQPRTRRPGRDAVPVRLRAGAEAAGADEIVHAPRRR